MKTGPKFTLFSFLLWKRKGIGKQNRISTIQEIHAILDSIYVPGNSVQKCINRITFLNMFLLNFR